MTATALGERATTAWVEQFQASFRAGEAHAFVLHGDIEGTAYEAYAQRTLLRAALLQRCEVVAAYTLCGGIEILGEDEEIEVDGRRVTRRQRALDLVGLGGGEPGAPASPLAAALAGIGPAAIVGPGGAPAPPDPFAAAGRSPVEALALLGRLLLADKRVGVIVDWADTVCPAPATGGKGAMSPEDRRVLVALLKMAKNERISKLGNPIFLLTRDIAELHPDLRAADSGLKAIELRLPDRADRLAYLAWYLDRREQAARPIPLLDLSRDELANLTAGLSLRNLEDVLLLGAQAGGVGRALLKAHKDATIQAQYSEVAEMVDPLPGGFDALGGMEGLKGWARDNIIGPVREGRAADVPKGVLLVGPPGGGKSHFVKALAREVGFSAVALNAANILGRFVGESERQLARFFGFCRSLAPVLVFCDELDQSDMSRRGNGSGNPVAANLFNAMLQFMADETLRGRVIMVFASNRPDLLDPALLRFGRMDAIIPVLLPGEEDRRAILAAQGAAQGTALPAAAVELLAGGADNYSAADLGALVRKLRQLTARAGRERPDRALAEEALRLIRPRSLETAEYYTLLAVSACNDAELLPRDLVALAADRAAFERRLAATRPGAAEGGGRDARDW